jgi:hypothetical protein
MSSNIPNSKITQFHLEKIRSITSKESQRSLELIGLGIDWELLAGSIAQKLSLYEIKYNSSNLVFVLKAIALEILFDIPISIINSEISDRKSFQAFLGIHNAIEIPESSLCIEVKKALLEKGLFDSFLILLETVLSENKIKKDVEHNNGTIDLKLEQLEEKLRKFKNIEPDSVFVEDKNIENDSTIISKLENFSKQLENATKSQNEPSFKRLKTLDEKLKDVNEKIDILFDKHVLKAEKENTDSREQLFDSNNLDQMKSLKQKTENMYRTTESTLKHDHNEQEVYKKLFDSFYNQLQNIAGTHKINRELFSNYFLEKSAKEEYDQTTLTKTQEDINEKLQKIEDEIKKIYDKIEQRETLKTKATHVSPLIQKLEEPGIQAEPENFIDLKKTKRYHIFNNANLTEDYELGLRFHKLGFKTAFINMRADEKDENTRIATAEYFPNTFWGSVKQRSRWIAGIVFQNWKIHKWDGNIRTRYFLLRDRKALLSFFGIFLSNLVFAYLIIYMVGLAINYPVPEPSVEKGSLLYYFMIGTLFFLITRVVHRFASTYNWYGFKYAALSLVRLIFDNFINLFATVRALKVYKANKKQTVWDSTEHY